MTQAVKPLIRIVDDDPEVLESLKIMLEVEGWSVKAYSSGKEMLRDLNGRIPGCVLLDVRMPDISGPELQTVLRERGADLPVVFITGYSDINVAISTLKSGALDFLLKPVDPDKLLEVTRTAVDRSLLRMAGVAVPENMRAVLSAITDQPRRVLEYMVQGLNNTAIAERMSLSVRTVQVYRSGLYKTLGVHSVRQFNLLVPYIKSAMAGSTE